MSPASGTTAVAMPAKAVTPGAEHEHTGVEKSDLVRIALVGLAVVFCWLRVWAPFPKIDIVGLGAVVLGGYPIFREAAADILSRRMTMELSMTIALTSALVIREVFTALVIVFFVLIAEALEEMTVGRGRRAIRDLLAFLPATAERKAVTGFETVPVLELVPGDVVIIRPGSRVPVDGRVVKGHSFVDQSTITGESTPAEKEIGSSVFADTISQTGALEVETIKVGRDTTFGRIIDVVEQAEESRAPVQRTADRLSGYLVYFALGFAALTYLVTRDARSTISVIIVAGACGVAAGTPLAILGAIGRAAKSGAIVKGGRHIEAMAEVDTVVLDETGTLTLGAPEVTSVEPSGISTQDLLRIAASAEKYSEHPVAAAIRRRAAELRIETYESSQFAAEPGKGIQCRVNGKRVIVGSRAYLRGSGILIPQFYRTSTASEVFVAEADQYVGRILVADVLRPEAKKAVEALHELGIRTLLLTGDVSAIAEAVGRDLGVNEVAGSLLPDDKLRRIQDLRSAGCVVAMVGDGVNDAPALVAANVGIAVGSGTDVARESASVLLLGDDLTRLADLLKIARQCHGIIMTNFFGTVAVDAVGVGLAAFGMLNPILAALIHVTSEMAFILNSARLVSTRDIVGPLAAVRTQEPLVNLLSNVYY
ncbi:MAG TPA: cation-translocating P-type ATPase [Bryobacteraceae bacterium]|jgi:heavy metal translocating P-type ATPase|nr:cation-translocating P-type ATPase [Bryobacteraceae bacterium]